MRPPLANRSTMLAAAAAAALFVAAPPVEAQQTSDVPPAEQSAQAAQSDGRANGKEAKNKPATTQPSTFMLIVPVPVVAVPATSTVPLLAPDGEAIRDTLAQATEAALTEDGLDDLVERFVDADRNRLGAGDVLDDSDAVDAAAERLKEAFRSKFNSDLDITREFRVYGGFPIIQGVITDNEPIPAAAREMPANDREDYNIEPGREVALVNVPKGGGLSEVIIPMLDEAGGWKIDVPNTLTAAELKQNLARHLNEAAEKLPGLQANADQAKRWITHHLMIGLMGMDSNTGAGQQQQGQQPQT